MLAPVSASELRKEDATVSGIKAATGSAMLAMCRSLCRSVEEGSVDRSALVEPVRTIGDLFGGPEAMALFEEWAPPRDRKGKALKLRKEQISANSNRDIEHKAGYAIGSGSEGWVSEGPAPDDVSLLTVRFAAPTRVDVVRFSIPSTKLAPATFDVRGEVPGHPGQWVVLARGLDGALLASGVDGQESGGKKKKKKEETDVPSVEVRVLVGGGVCSRLQIRQRGYHRNNRSRNHGLQELVVEGDVVVGGDVHVGKAGDVLEGVAKFLTTIASENATDEAGCEAVRALSRLASSSGSLGHLAASLQVLVAQGQSELGSVASGAASDLATTLHAARVDATDALHCVRGLDGGSGASGDDGNDGPLEFVPQRYCELRNGNTEAFCNEEVSNGYAVVNRMIRPGMVVEVEMVLGDPDESGGRNDGAFGLSSNPSEVTRTGFRGGTSSIMWQCRGEVFVRGASTGRDPGKRYRIGNSIRMRVDLTGKGEVRGFVEGKDVGIIATGISGPLYPFAAWDYHCTSYTIKSFELVTSGDDDAVPSAVSAPVLYLAEGKLRSAGVELEDIAMGEALPEESKPLRLPRPGGGMWAAKHGLGIPLPTEDVGGTAEVSIQLDPALGFDMFRSVLGNSAPKSKKKGAKKGGGGEGGDGGEGGGGAAMRETDVSAGAPFDPSGGEDEEAKEDWGAGGEDDEEDEAGARSVDEDGDMAALGEDGGDGGDGMGLGDGGEEDEEEAKEDATVVLQVLLDDEEVYCSDAVVLEKDMSSTVATEVLVNVRGARRLTLRAKCTGAAPKRSLAVFGDALLRHAPWVLEWEGLGKAEEGTKGKGDGGKKEEEEEDGVMSKVVSRPLPSDTALPPPAPPGPAKGALAATGVGAAARILSVIEPLCREAQSALDRPAPARTDTSAAIQGVQAEALSFPIVLDAHASAIDQIHGVVRLLANGVEERVGKSDEDEEAIVWRSSLLQALQLLRVNLARLSFTRVHPGIAGFAVPVPCEDDEGNAAGEAPLPSDVVNPKPLHALLLHIAAKDSPFFAEARAAAADVVDAALQIFFPTHEARKELLLSLTEGGWSGVIEVEVRFPFVRTLTASQKKKLKEEAEASGSSKLKGAAAGDPDPRYERLLLLLQAAVVRSGWKVAFHALWKSTAHIILSPGQKRKEGGGGEKEEEEQGPAIGFLLDELSPILAMAGLGGWEFPVGASVASIGFEITRELVEAKNRCARWDKRAGRAGILRLYPAGTVDAEAAASHAAEFLEQDSARIEEEILMEEEEEQARQEAEKQQEVEDRLAGGTVVYGPELPPHLLAAAAAAEGGGGEGLAPIPPPRPGMFGGDESDDEEGYGFEF